MLRIALDRTWPEVIAGWQNDAAFRASFIDQLRAAPYEACFWECIRVSTGSFECVVLDAPELARSVADPRRLPST